MRIAHMGTKGLPSNGGAERVMEAIVRRLAVRHEITVYCRADYTPADVRVPGVRLLRIPTLPGKHLQPMSLFVLSAFHAVFFGDYDLIHVHNVEACWVLPLLRLRYKVIATAQGSMTRLARSKWGPVARTLMGLAEYPYLFLPNCVTSVSQVDADYFEQRYGRMVVYVPNGVDEQPAAAADNSILHQIGAQPGQYLLFAAGRIDPTKGCHLVLQAFGQLNLDMKLLVVGDLEQVPEYGQRVRQMANDKVVFVPHISSKEQFFGIVRSCRLFIFPSIFEGMSLMLLEAASFGLPLICSDIPENRAVLGRRALYFRSGDAGDLAEKLSWATQHLDVMASYARQAEAWVKQNHSWDKIADDYEALYQQCLQGRPNGLSQSAHGRED